MFSRADSKCLI